LSSSVPLLQVWSQGTCLQLVPDFNPSPSNALSTVSDCICSQLPTTAEGHLLLLPQAEDAPCSGDKRAKLSISTSR
jgi:hypothetical protein